ncbi:YceI family protein [Mycolicibacterium sphagni]|nr:YceI family protein [Mycolicibacterium sphagni]
MPYYTPGTWVIDPASSSLSFSVRHFGFHHARGRMAVSGSMVVSDDPLDSAVDALIDLGSVDTGNPGRDNAIRSQPLLDVANRPTATYRSRALTVVAATREETAAYLLHGDLTLLGVMRAVPLRINIEFMPGTAGHRLVVRGRAQLDRQAFDVRYRRGPRILDRTIASTVAVDVHLEGRLGRSQL